MSTFKRMVSCIREYKRPSLLAPIFIALEVLVECCIPYLTAQLINYINASEGSTEGFLTKIIYNILGYDTAMTELRLEVILVYGLMLFFLAALSMTFGALSAHFCSIASCGFAKNLRHDVYYKIQGFSFENIDKFSTPSLVTRLTTDVSNVQMAYMMIIRTAIRCPLMLIISSVMSIQLGGSLAWLFAGIIPVLGFGLFFIISRARPLFKKIFKKYDKLNESVQENIRGMRVVKSFVREDYERAKFDRASDEVRRDFERADKLLALNTPIMQFCIYTAMLVISFVCATTVIGTNESGLIKVGTLSGMLTYSMQIMMSMMMVSMIFVMVTMAIEAANRIAEVLNEESTLKSPENPVMTLENGDVDFEGVSFKYNQKAEKYALENINLHIKSGQTVGILGVTGSSKSTLISLIPRLYDATAGSVKVGGVDVRDYDLDVLRNGVSVVLQKNLLFSGTIKENLRWGDPDATDEELERICKLAMADEFIQNMPDKYDTYIEQGGTNVSGGQKQRLCIARALLKKPKVLILDDSTSAVDTKTDAMIRKAFREEIPGTTKFIIAQRIASVQDSDVIIMMDDGKIGAVGSHEELMRTSEMYRDVFHSQTKGGSDNE
ncbi:MAG: ABC transporter ATP-binding protein [Clostridia bacterium]|nr:ABC transporter ATP-binding protein [Clostridia bacterium]